MDLISAITGRRSIRKFLPEDIPDEDIVRMISMATLAPNAGNRQMWHFVIIKDGALKEKMRDAVTHELERLASLNGLSVDSLRSQVFHATLFVAAPVVIAVLTEPYRSRLDDLLLGAGLSEREVDQRRCRPDLQSVAAAIQNLMLTAHCMGYGTCWMVGPLVARPALEALLGVQSPRSLAALVALGRPAKLPGPRPMKKVEEVITFIDGREPNGCRDCDRMEPGREGESSKN